MSRAKYVYQLFNHVKDQICLVTFKAPAAVNEPIRCELQVFDISEAPPYTALSYAWGPPELVQRIYVDDQALKIVDSLFLFLQEFRAQKAKEPSDQYL